MITNYSLNPVLLGQITKEGNYYLYFRYYYSVKKKKFTKDIPTNIKLTKEQYNLFKNNELKGELLKSILAKQVYILDTIKKYYNENITYPTNIKLGELLGINGDNHEISIYIKDFLNKKILNTKPSTISTYYSYTNMFITFFESKNLRNFALKSILNQDTIDDFHVYLKAKGNSNASIHNKLSVIKDLFNHIAEKLKSPKPQISFNINFESEKLFLTQEDINNMLFLDISNLKCYINLKRSLVNCQRLIFINMFLGLRIGEILNVRKSQVFKHATNPYYIIRFEEKKKSQLRDVIIKDIHAMRLIDELLQLDNPFPFKLFKNEYCFNSVFKKLARHAGLKEKVELYQDGKYICKEKWRFVSSHAIRRFAVTNNILKYNMEIAMLFSGHKSYHIVKKHYLQPFTSEQTYEKMKEFELK